VATVAVASRQETKFGLEHKRRRTFSKELKLLTIEKMQKDCKRRDPIQKESKTMNGKKSETTGSRESAQRCRTFGFAPKDANLKPLG
jgi:hypothetical protein